jgi:hypothetical protein
MSACCAEAGIQAPDERTPSPTDPPRPAAVKQSAARWGIEFWTRPTDTTPPGRGP